MPAPLTLALPKGRLLDPTLQLLSAMGNIQTGRLLDPRFQDLDGAIETVESEAASPFAIVD